MRSRGPRPRAEPSVIAGRDRVEKGYWTRRLALMPHRPSYFLPVTYSRDLVLTDDDAGTATTRAAEQNTEIKFQLSLKLPLVAPPDATRSALFVAYTWQAWWQAYQLDRSNPFREYNHEPELFLSMPTDQRRRWLAGRTGESSASPTSRTVGRTRARGAGTGSTSTCAPSADPGGCRSSPGTGLPERLFGAGRLAVGRQCRHHALLRARRTARSAMPGANA